MQHFRSAVFDAWRDKVAADLCGREGFRGGPCWICLALCSCLILLMLVNEIRLCFGVSWLVESGIVTARLLAEITEVARSRGAGLGWAGAWRWWQGHGDRAAVEVLAVPWWSTFL